MVLPLPKTIVHPKVFPQVSYFEGLLALNQSEVRLASMKENSREDFMLVFLNIAFNDKMPRFGVVPIKNRSHH